MKAKRKGSESQVRKLAIVLCAVVLLLAAGLLAFLAAGQLTRPVFEAVATAPAVSAPFEEARYEFGRGIIGDDWQVYFTEPDAAADSGSYADGIDAALAAAIAGVRQTLDIAAFELNNDIIFSAILDAQRRGVVVRIVADNEHGLQDDHDRQLRDLREAGIAIVDDGRSALMHNKFMILDGQEVWTGSWNYTVNGTYRNNNNALVLESPEAVAGYLAEFEEMFRRGEFGVRSRDEGVISASLDGGEIRIIFAPEAEEIGLLAQEIAQADESIRIMTFVFSLGELAEVMLDQMNERNVIVEGVFEKRNSAASWSQLPTLYCAGADLRQDGNPHILHHKVLLIDDDTVITGSFNFSKAAAQSNDENIVIIRDADIASAYLDEWRRIWESAAVPDPDDIDCD